MEDTIILNGILFLLYFGESICSGYDKIARVQYKEKCSREIMLSSNHF